MIQSRLNCRDGSLTSMTIEDYQEMICQEDSLSMKPASKTHYCEKVSPGR